MAVHIESNAATMGFKGVSGEDRVVGLFNNKADRNLPLLTQIYRLNEEDPAQLLEFYTADKLRRYAGTDAERRSEEEKQDIAHHFEIELGYFKSLCKLTVILMNALVNQGPTMNMLVELDKWRQLYSLRWTRRADKNTMISLETEDDTRDATKIANAILLWKPDAPIAPENIVYEVRVKPGVWSFNPLLMEEIVNHLDQLILQYKERRLLIRRCQECGNLYIMQRDRGDNKFCSFLCGNRHTVREARRQKKEEKTLENLVAS